MAYYILLLLSILFEVIGVSFLNFSNGFTLWMPALLAVIFYCSSIAIYISLSVNREVGVVNAVFAGTGTALVTVMGIIWFEESLSALKITGIGLIVCGTISINLKPNRKGEVS